MPISANVGFSIDALYDNTAGGYSLLWNAAIPLTPSERGFFFEYVSDPCRALLNFGAISVGLRDVSRSLRVLNDIASQFLRTAAEFTDIDEFERHVVSSLLYELPDRIADIPRPDCLNRVLFGLTQALREMTLSKKGGILPLFEVVESVYTRAKVLSTLSFSIEENFSPSSPSAPFILTASCKNRSGEYPLCEAMERFKGDSYLVSMIVGSIRRAAQRSALIRKMYNGGNIIDKLSLNIDDLRTFVIEAPIYASCGIVARIPNKWKKRRGILSLSATVGNSSLMLGADMVLSFDLKAALNGVELTQDDIDALLGAEKDGVTLFRGQWIELKKSELELLLKACDKVKESYNGSMTLFDCLRACISPQKILPQGLNVDITINQGTWLRDLSERLLSPHGMTAPELGDTFKGELRPYQRDGLNWLYLMKRLGLGACLSDDMGLGKTIQAIALLELTRRENAESPPEAEQAWNKSTSL